jgi:hypothetical protein
LPSDSRLGATGHFPPDHSAAAVACHGGCRPVVIHFSFDHYVLSAFTNGTTNTWPIVL